MRRADSRRDFYAKALALFGLGLLGAIAAVVDNWPAASVVSTAAARIEASTAPQAPLRLDLKQLSVTSEAAVPRVASARTAARSEPPQTSAITTAVPDFEQPRLSVEQPSALPESISPLTVDQGMPMGVRFASATFVDAPEAMPVVFIGPVEDHDYLMAAPSMRSASVGASMNDGFFSGAVKKTQDTLAKTGSTIVDAFRAVGGAVGAVGGAMGGAVKRVMPF